MTRWQKGAVGVEFLIVSSTLLLSMFYLIPMLGKYMDIRHMTEEAARYGVWERTVWNGKVGEYNGVTSLKSAAQIQNEITHRVLGDGLVYAQQSEAAELSKFKLGSFHNYSNVLNGTYDKLVIKNNDGGYVSFSEVGINQVAPSKGSNVVDKGLHAVGVFLERVTPLNTKGYYTNQTSIDANIPLWFDSFKSDAFSSKKLAFNASNSILVDAWGAGGVEDNKDKVRAMRAVGVNKSLEFELSTLRAGFLPYYWFSKEIRGKDSLGNDKFDIDKVDVELLLEGEDPNDPNSHVEKF